VDEWPYNDNATEPYDHQRLVLRRRRRQRGRGKVRLRVQAALVDAVLRRRLGFGRIVGSEIEAPNM
jgi:hypothetical protein